MIYPEMTVEERNPEHAHGLKPPMAPDHPLYLEQKQEVIDLCDGRNDGEWSLRVIEILEKHMPVDFLPGTLNIPSLMKEFGFNSWMEVCEFVKDDECIEWMVKVAKYCKRNGFKVKKTEKDFLKGQGFGIYLRYLDRVMGASEQSFDAKWFYKRERLLEEIYKDSGLDLSCIAGYVHPGHYSYPAQHSVKFYKCVDVAESEWEIKKWYRKSLIAASYIASMGRSGILVHRIEDNLAGGYIADLPEFNNWKQ